MAISIRTLFYFMLCLAAGFAFGQFFVGFSNDNNTLLHYSVHLLRDGGLYRDWIEINPPLIMLLYCVPALGILAGINPDFIFQLFIFTLSCISLLTIEKTLRSRPDMSREQRQIWFGASLFLLVISPCLYSVTGDREHLFLVFSWPWVLQMLLRQQPTKISAVFAAVGFFIKPYNLIVCFALLFFGGPQDNTILKRVFSSSAIIIGFMGLLYTGVVLVLFPDYFAQVTQLAQAYAFLGNSRMDYIIKVCPWLFLMLYAADCIGRGERRAWLAFLAGMTGVFFLNGGWQYTQYLLIGPMGVLAFIIAVRLFQVGKLNFEQMVVRTFCLFIAATIGVMSLMELQRDIRYTRHTGYAYNYHHLPTDMMEGLKAEIDGNFVMLSTTFWAASLADYDRSPRHVYAFDCLWPLPWLVANQDAQKAPLVREAMTKPLVKALNADNPPVIIIDESVMKRHLPNNFDIRAFMMKDPAVRKAFARYKRVRTLTGVIREFDNPARASPPLTFSVWRAN